MTAELAATHDLVQVDAGDAFSKHRTLVPVDLQASQEVKAELQVRALMASGLHAFVPGAGDLALGAPFLQRMVAEHGLPVLAANLVCEDRRFEATQVVEAGGRRVGLVGLVGPRVQTCEVEDAASALTAALAALQDVDLRVLVVHGERNFVEQHGATPGFDFVVTGGAGSTRTQPKRLEEGGWQLAAGSRGKKLGVVELEWREGATGWTGEGQLAAIATRLDRYRERVKDMDERIAVASKESARQRAVSQREHYVAEVARLEQELAEVTASLEGGDHHRFSSRLVELDATIEDHAEVGAWTEEAKLRVNALVARSEASRDAYLGPFVGSGRCSSCHRPQYLQWKETGHASAWPTLVDAGRQGDPECVTCHATGQWHPEGPRGVAVETHLRGVGCEDCHGPGDAHVTSPTRGMVGRPGRSTCVRCHDGERDEGRFDEPSYLPRVACRAG